ncbi:amino acid permease [Amycolatopsis sp. H20-H5]|uniref:amino acid permease n=1 Tax=Amycolatopsis sp. H20-H5 TaxID=3046309 RepID=UPI002DBE5216|nr:amino acid permease [Amycolatopsis sp. H20-H5]MEC3975818.1 amino acid permease [Amycolatopsis sp. H20-H5]
MTNSPKGSGLMNSRPVLLFAFAFAVMADPVSSVAYAIEAALRALHGDLALLLPTMGLVVAIVVLVIVNYHQLVARYPQGGGAAAATGEAFGEGAAFIPIGALIVDFVLTIAISSAAGASAIIAFVPALAPWRVLIAVLLVVAVAGGTWFGHLGRTVFAVMTVGFILLAVAVLVSGLFVEPHPAVASSADPGHSPVLAVALAFPVAMALATGIEAPSSAIAQLGQLDDPGRRRFGRVTLWLTLGVVGTITLGLTAQAVRLGIGVPHDDTTQIAELARAATSTPVFAAFQLTTALLLLSAASSSFQAGPGLFKALARQRDTNGVSTGILPTWLGRTNSHHTPYWGVVVFMLAAAIVTAAAGGRDQELVLFYAASVFVSFLAGLLAMSRFSLREKRFGFLAINVIGAVAVGFTLAVNLTRGDPIISIAGALLISFVLYRLWVRSGRPRGIRNVAADAEHE